MPNHIHNNNSIIYLQGEKGGKGDHGPMGLPVSFNFYLNPHFHNGTNEINLCYRDQWV